MCNYREENGIKSDKRYINNPDKYCEKHNLYIKACVCKYICSEYNAGVCMYYKQPVT